jgi:hypothetical protein
LARWYTDIRRQPGTNSFGFALYADERWLHGGRGVVWQRDLTGIDGGDVRISLKYGREDHVPKRHQGMHDGAGRLKVEHGCSRDIRMGRTRQSDGDRRR